MQLSEIQQAWLSEIGVSARFINMAISKPQQSAVKPLTPVTKPVSDANRVVENNNSPEVTHDAVNIKPVRSKFTTLEEAALAASECTACELHANRHNVVFGAGVSPNPNWFVVGSAPGRADDRTGIPFQNEAGTMLESMFLAVGIHPRGVSLGPHSSEKPKWSEESDIYFTNLIKCRPSTGLPQSISHIRQCSGYLQAQLRLVNPKLILALGELAAQSLLGSNKPLEELRGKVHSVQVENITIPLVATWDPYNLTVHPKNKLLAWQDMLLAYRTLTS